MRSQIQAIIVMSAAVVAACSGTAVIPGTGTWATNAELAVLNALPANGNLRLLLDNVETTLPAPGQSSTIPISAGTHHLTATSASGMALASADFTIMNGAVRTAVISGTDSGSIALDMAVDTASHGGSLAAIQLVDSVSLTGSYDFSLHRLGTDSLLVFSIGSSIGNSSSNFLPFMPATYAVSVTAPGSATVLVQTQITVAAGETWNLVLENGRGGTLTLQANNLNPAALREPTLH